MAVTFRRDEPNWRTRDYLLRSDLRLVYFPRKPTLADASDYCTTVRFLDESAAPNGNYAMKLDLVDNLNPGKTLAETVAVPVRVE